MQRGFVTLPEAMQIMTTRDKAGKPFPFEMTYRTFNSQSKKGGVLKTFLAAKYLPDANPETVHIDTMFNILDPIKRERKPNHFDNRTRNIEVTPDEIRKIRIDFIISINNKPVIY